MPPTAMDYFWAFVAIIALAVGVLSMAVGQIMRAWDWLTYWWEGWLIDRYERRHGTEEHAAEPVPATREPAEPDMVLPHLNHQEPDEPNENEPVREPPPLYRLSRIEEIALLAVQRRDDGTYRHSANEITKFIGGTAAEVKQQIADIRATKSEPEEKPAERVSRPPKGWVNSA